MKADAITLHKMLKARIVMHEHTHHRQPSVTAIAQMLSTVLYYKRFFPYYTFNILAGTDAEGKGACYHYDAIGSSLVMSVLDCQIGALNQTIKPEAPNKEKVV